MDRALLEGAVSLGHAVVPASETSAAVAAQSKNGAFDKLDDVVTVGKATGVDWVLFGTVRSGVDMSRVELGALLVRAGRTESVARDLEASRLGTDVREMLAVLLRAEGIGTGALPWELAHPMQGDQGTSPSGAVWSAHRPERRAMTQPRLANAPGMSPEHLPAYGGHRGFLVASSGLWAPVARPASAGKDVGNGTSFVVLVRGGYAIGDLGLEPFAELGWNLFGPPALWLAGGARWMFAPLLQRGADGIFRVVPVYVGPQVSAGMFVELGGQTVLPQSGVSYGASANLHALAEHRGRCRLCIVAASLPGGEPRQPRGPTRRGWCDGIGRGDRRRQRAVLAREPCTLHCRGTAADAASNDRSC